MNAGIQTVFLINLLSSLPSQADVNMKDAGYFKTFVDVEVKNNNSVFQLRRLYQSRSLHQGIFGFGWCTDFEKSLDLTRSDQISLRDCRLNAPIKFKKIKPNLYQAPNNESLEFQNSTYVYTSRLKTSQRFNRLGRLISLVSAGGDQLELNYDFKGSLQSILFGSTELRIKWNPSQKYIQSIKSDKTPGVFYQYQNGNLTQVVNAWGSNFEYRYDEFHNLTRVDYPDKTQELVTYNEEKDWVIKIKKRNQCEELFQFLPHKKGVDYSSSAEKRCQGKVVAKTVYEFKHKVRADGSKYLEQVNITQGNKLQRISYRQQEPIDESQ